MVRGHERASDRLRRSVHTKQALLTCHHRLAHRVGRPVRRKRRPTAAVDKSPQRLTHKKPDTSDKAVPSELDIHCIADNYATHSHPKIKALLASRPRWH